MVKLAARDEKIPKTLKKQAWYARKKMELRTQRSRPKAKGVEGDSDKNEVVNITMSTIDL